MSGGVGGPPSAVVGSPDVTAVAPHAEVEGATVHALVATGDDGASFAATTPSLGPLELWRLRPAALTAEGRSTVSKVGIIARGYENFITKLELLGADFTLEG